MLVKGGIWPWPSKEGEVTVEEGQKIGLRDEIKTKKNKDYYKRKDKKIGTK